MSVELKVTHTKTRKRIAVFVFQTLFFVIAALIVFVTVTVTISAMELEDGERVGLFVLIYLIAVGLIASLPPCALSLIFGGFALASTNKAIKFFAVVFEVFSALYLLALLILILVQGNAA